MNRESITSSVDAVAVWLNELADAAMTQGVRTSAEAESMKLYGQAFAYREAAAMILVAITNEGKPE